MPVLIVAGETDPDRRTIGFHLVQPDGITPALAEAGGQPQIAINGAAFGAAGIGPLVAIGFGRYEAVIDEAAVATAGTRIESRYKSGFTAECPGDSVRVTGIDIYAPGGRVTLADEAITEAAIQQPDEIAGLPPGILGMMRRVFEWGVRPKRRNRRTGRVELYGVAGAVIERQTQSTETDAAGDVIDRIDG